MAVEIWPATPDDARAIAEVHVASWQWAYRDILPAAVLDALSVEARVDMWASMLHGSPTGSVVLVASVDDAVVGFASAGPSRGSDSPDDTAEVFTLYLLQSMVGLGIGRALLSTLVGSLRAQGYGRAVLWVLEANDRARRFYEAAGWRDDTARDTYEVAGVDYPEVRYVVGL